MINQRTGKGILFIRKLIELGAYDKRVPMLHTGIENLSTEFIRPLKRAGLIDLVGGKHGGVLLIKEHITAKDIYIALESKPCFDDDTLNYIVDKMLACLDIEICTLNDLQVEMM